MDGGFRNNELLRQKVGGDSYVFSMEYNVGYIRGHTDHCAHGGVRSENTLGDIDEIGGKDGNGMEEIWRS